MGTELAGKGNWLNVNTNLLPILDNWLKTRKRCRMNKEPIKMLAGFLLDRMQDTISKDIQTWFDIKGYAIINKDELIKEAGLIVDEKLVVK